MPFMFPACSLAGEQAGAGGENAAVIANRPSGLRTFLISSHELERESRERRRPNAEELSEVRRDVRRASRDAYSQLPVSKRAKPR